MAKHKITGWLYYRAADRYSKTGEPTVSLLPFAPEHAGDSWGVGVREHSVEVEIPDDFDPRPIQVAALEKQKQEIRAKFAAAVKEIDDRIASLLAIDNKPSEVTE
jgi:hypothetical protein